jgi:iron(III) transport system permease protein
LRLDVRPRESRLGRDTLAIMTWEATKASRFDTAALPALLIVLVGLVPVVALVRLWGTRPGAAIVGVRPPDPGA